MNITENGRYLITSSSVVGQIVVFGSGTFGAAEVDLQYKDPGGNYVTLANGTFVTNFQEVVNIGRGQDLYVNVTGGTGVNLYIETGDI